MFQDPLVGLLSLMLDRMPGRRLTYKREEQTMDGQRMRPTSAIRMSSVKFFVRNHTLKIINPFFYIIHLKHSKRYQLLGGVLF